MMPSEKSGHNATQAEHGTPIACVPNDASTQKEKNKLVRRALSMPRNLFRLSRRVKLTSSTKTAAHKNATKSDTNPTTTDHSASDTTCGTDTDNVHVQLNESSEAPTISDKSLQSKRNRLFHRSTWKRFLTRVAQQMTSSSNAVRVPNRVIIDVFFCLVFVSPSLIICVKSVFAAEKGRFARGQWTGAVDGAACVAAGSYPGRCRPAKPRQYVLHECGTAMPEPHRYLGRVFCARSVQGACRVSVSHTR